jgi:hypothetical protein
MMRILITCLLLCPGLFLAAQSKKQVKDLKIKSMTETTTLYRDGKESGTYKSEYKTFDKEGNTTLEIQYNENGSIRKKQTTKYAGKDKAEEITENNGSTDDGEDSGPKKYKRVTWKYNSNGDKIEEVEYDAAGNVLKKTTIAYGKNGDKLIEMEVDGAGKLLKKTAYGYDSRGLRIEKKVTGPNDVMLKHVTYTYTF